MLNEASSEIGGRAFSNHVRSRLYSIMSRTSIVAGRPDVKAKGTIAVSEIFEEEDFGFFALSVNFFGRVRLSLALGFAIISLALDLLGPGLEIR